MQSLMQTLASKEPFYVRCIKPNEVKSPSAFDDKRVEHQIRSVQVLFRVMLLIYLPHFRHLAERM